MFRDILETVAIAKGDAATSSEAATNQKRAPIMKYPMKKTPIQSKQQTKRTQTQTSMLSQSATYERSNSNQNHSRTGNPTQLPTKAIKTVQINQNYATMGNSKTNSLICISAKRRRGGVAPAEQVQTQQKQLQYASVNLGNTNERATRKATKQLGNFLHQSHSFNKGSSSVGATKRTSQHHPPTQTIPNQTLTSQSHSLQRKTFEKNVGASELLKLLKGFDSKPEIADSESRQQPNALAEISSNGQEKKKGISKANIKFNFTS